MKKSLFIPIFLVLVLTANISRSQSGMLSFEQMLDLMHHSKVSYAITPVPTDSVLDLAMNVLTQRQRRYTAAPRVSVENGVPTISNWVWEGLSPEVDAQAAQDFSANNISAARADYQKVLKASPDCYIAVANLGYCFMLEGKTDSAIAYYDKAIEMSKIDFLPYYYKADALYKAKRYEEARQAMIDVLTLRPRYAKALQQLREMPNLGVTVHDSLFAPKGFAYKEPNRVLIECPSDTMLEPWRAYAIGKAIWLGEPAHRDSLTGSSSLSWSVLHEVECFGALLESYEHLRGKHPPLADIEKIEAVTSDNLLNACTLYEIGSRFDEDIMLTVDPSIRVSVRMYVEKYILPKS